MRVKLSARESEHLSFGATWQTTQCTDCVVRIKNEYGLLLFADKRYAHAHKRTKLAQWISDLMPTFGLSVMQ